MFSVAIRKTKLTVWDYPESLEPSSTVTGGPDVPSGTVTLQLVTGTYLVTTAYFKVLP